MRGPVVARAWRMVPWGALGVLQTEARPGAALSNAAVASTTYAYARVSLAVLAVRRHQHSPIGISQSR